MLWNKFFCRMMLIAAVGFIFLYPGYRRLRFFKQRIAHLDSEISVLEEKNRNLMEEIEALKKDPFYLEKLARDMGFVKEGEVIYKVTEKEENNKVSEEIEQKQFKTLDSRLRGNDRE